MIQSVPPPQIVATTIVRGPNLNVAFPHLLLCTLTTEYTPYRSHLYVFTTAHNICYEEVTRNWSQWNLALSPHRRFGEPWVTTFHLPEENHQQSDVL